MIPMMNIIAWARMAPWAEQRQIEQDLIISRAIVEVFNDPFLSEELRFRGGTALNKLHFPEPLRYSEDIDLVRTSSGPIGPILDGLRQVLEPWLGRARFDQSEIAPKLRFRVDAEDKSPPLQVKIEINTRETEAKNAPLRLDYSVSNTWFTGQASIHTFSTEEMLATKLRALLQRNKGRDLLDLSHGISTIQVDIRKTLDIFQQYLAMNKLEISRAQAEQRMFAKLNNPGFVADIRPLLSADAAERLTDAVVKATFVHVMNSLIERLPGDPWARTSEMTDRFNLPP